MILRKSLLPLIFALGLAGCERDDPKAAEAPVAPASTPSPEPVAPPEAPAAEEDTAPAAAAEPAAEEPVEAVAAEPDANGQGSPAEAEEPAPPEVDAKAIFWGSPEDPPAELLHATRKDLEGRHYLYGDEWNLHLFREYIGDLGGGYVGVGSDQAYLFIGWMKPERAWLTDYDPWIVRLHEAYLAFFEAAPDFEAFERFWEKEGMDDARAAIAKRWAGHPDVDEIDYVYRKARHLALWRIRKLRKILRDHDVPSYLTDAATYDDVRQRILDGRVRPMLGNLFGTKGLLGIAEAGRKLGVPIRAVYVSNAEDYWAYPDQFKKNFQGMYFDDKSVILRTNATKKRNEDYRYGVQKALNFQEWLEQPYVKRVGHIWSRPHVRSADHVPITFLDEEPFDRRAAKE
jgi:hypothetical protein